MGVVGVLLLHRVDVRFPMALVQKLTVLGIEPSNTNQIPPANTAVFISGFAFHYYELLSQILYSYCYNVSLT